ncbi:glycine--tRNA ligase [Candidatus Beckwithbacteria bacterium]|nr:glycine--tRNA ligase [Candidatus Beckwithbacteria bacterium]
MTTSLQDIVAVAKRRGFVYPSSEIYGGFAAIYDYGPVGAELLNNIKAAWWRYMVQLREDVVGLDSAIFMHPKTWEASGHVAGFSDPLVECRACHARSRADHLLAGIGVAADEKMSAEEINQLFESNKNQIKCPNCQAQDFSQVKKFNLLVQSNLGNFTGDWTKEPSYLRGETCQGIYLNYKNVLDSTRVKIPFGIAQIGKAFRNEITARQFIFRTREFEQMEMQYFVHPDQEMVAYDELKKYRWQFYLDLGIDEQNLQWHEHENLVFYAKAAYDIEFRFPFGFDELEGIHARGDYDLTQHQTFSGQDLMYTDPFSGEKYLPHIIESSVGVNRIMLAILTQSYTQEKDRLVLKLPKKLAPYKVAVFPLLKNKEEIVAKAKSVYDQLKLDFMTAWDERGNIGKRYYGQDEIGTPFCVTIDFETLEKDSVTVRDRDTMVQERVVVSQLKNYLADKLAQ